MNEIMEIKARILRLESQFDRVLGLAEKASVHESKMVFILKDHASRIKELERKDEPVQ